MCLKMRFEELQLLVMTRVAKGVTSSEEEFTTVKPGVAEG